MAGFRIPEGYSPVGTIVFRYPAEFPEAHDKHARKSDLGQVAPGYCTFPKSRNYSELLTLSVPFRDSSRGGLITF